MIVTALQISCFLPNATFSYNPILLSGYLDATFIPPSSDIEYEICRGLDGFLFRAEIDLAETGENATNVEEVSPVALSSNSYFQADNNIRIKLSVEQDNDDAAQRTTQSNFRLQFMETDVTVQQTLSFFAVQTYNTEECFQDTKMYVEQNEILIETQFLNCELNFTNYGKFVGSSSLKAADARAVLRLAGFGEIFVNIGAIMNESYEQHSNLLQILFECENFDHENATLCSRMTDFLQTSTQYEVSFGLVFDVSDSGQEIELTEDIAAFEDKNYANCLTGQYILAPAFMIIDYAISNETRCEITNYSAVHARGIIQHKAKYSEGLYYNFIDYQSRISLGQGQLTIECAVQDDPDVCQQSLEQFLLLDTAIFELKLNYDFTSGEKSFLSTQLQHGDECFGAVWFQLMVDDEDENGGYISVSLQILDNENCQMVEPMRHYLTITVTQPVMVDGEMTEEELLRLSERDDFSQENTTIRFDCDDCRQQLNKIGELLAKGQAYGSLYVDKIKFYTSSFANRVVIKWEKECIGIALAMGVALSIVGYLLNDAAFIYKMRRRKATSVANAINPKSTE